MKHLVNRLDALVDGWSESRVAFEFLRFVSNVLGIWGASLLGYCLMVFFNDGVKWAWLDGFVSVLSLISTLIGVTLTCLLIYGATNKPKKPDPLSKTLFAPRPCLGSF